MTSISTFTKQILRTITVALAAVVFLQPDVVVAQQTGPRLDEIVVTAQRRAQSLTEVPLAIEVFSGNEIRRQGFRDLDDLANFSPTVLIEPRVQDQDVAIRGFGTTGNTLTHDQAAPFFVDGIHFGRQSQVKLAFLDIESLEVLKGPQPVYFGQNATAGAFNIRSRRPTAEWQGYINAEFASDNTNEFTFGIGGPISDTWGIRVAGMHESSDGYMVYVATGDDLGAYESTGGRVMLQFTPNDKLQITGKVDVIGVERDGETMSTCITGGPMLFGRDGALDDPGSAPGPERSVWDQATGTPWAQPILPLDNATTTGCFESNHATSQGGPYLDPPPRNVPPILDANDELIVDDDDDGLPDPNWWMISDGRFDLPTNITGVRQHSSDGGFVDMRAAADAFTKSMGGKGVLGYERLDGVNSFIELVYDFDNDMTLEWLSGTSDYERDYALDNRDGPFFTNLQHRDEDFTQWSTELRVRSAPGRTVEWEAGGFFQHTELEAFSSSLRASVRQSQRFNSITEEVDFTGFFANLTFNVSDQFSIDIGGRHQDVDKFATVGGYSASWIFAVCPEDNPATPAEECDTGLTLSSVQWDPTLDDGDGDWPGCEGRMADGRGRIDRDTYCLVDPSTARLFLPVPAGAQLYAIPHRETRYIPLAWNAGNAIPVGLTAPDFLFRSLERSEGPYAESFTESGFSPQVSLRYRPTDNISLYLRYAESFKIGGYDTGQSTIPADVEELTYETEDAEQIELGIKGTLMEGRFSFDADLFELEFPNLQVSVLSTDPEQTSAAGNAGQRVRGLEFNTRFAATDHLILGFAGALMDGEMTRFPGAGCTDSEVAVAVDLHVAGTLEAPCKFFDPDTVLPDGTLAQEFPTDPEDAFEFIAIIDRTNLPAPRTPDWKFILDADYTAPFGNGYEFTINAKAFFSDGYIVDVEGFGEELRYDKHEDLNILVGIRNVDAGWTLSAFGRNLLEARPTYHPEFDPFPEGTISQFLGPQAFTSYGVKFEYEFD